MTDERPSPRVTLRPNWSARSRPLLPPDIATDGGHTWPTAVVVFAPPQLSALEVRAALTDALVDGLRARAALSAAPGGQSSTAETGDGEATAESAQGLQPEGAGSGSAPSTEPGTERVPWWEAVGRRVPDGPLIGSSRSTEEDVRLFGPDDNWLADPDLDGTVEVLVERPWPPVTEPEPPAVETEWWIRRADGTEMGHEDWGQFIHLRAQGPDDWSPAEEDGEARHIGGPPETYEMLRADLTVVARQTITVVGDVVTTVDHDDPPGPSPQPAAPDGPSVARLREIAAWIDRQGVSTTGREMHDDLIRWAAVLDGENKAANR